MAKPLAKFLQEVSTDGPDFPSPFVKLRSIDREAAAPPPAPAIETKLEEAYARGRADAEAQARAEAEQRHLEQITEFGRQLETARQAFSDQVAKGLTEDLSHIVEQFTDQMADQLVSALLPVMRHVLSEAAIRELARSIREMAPDDQIMIVELSGPQELLGRVEASYLAVRGAQAGAKGPAVKFVPADTFEVRARVNDTIIESRLMEWVGRVMEAAG